MTRIGTTISTVARCASIVASLALLGATAACRRHAQGPVPGVAPFLIEPSYLDVGASIEEHSAGGIALRVSPGSSDLTEARWNKHTTRKVLALSGHVPALMQVRYHAYTHGIPGQERTVPVEGHELLIDYSGPEPRATTLAGVPMALPQLVAVRDERWPSLDSWIAALAYERLWHAGVWIDVPTEEIEVDTIVLGDPLQMAVSGRIRLVELQGNEALFEVEVSAERRVPHASVTVDAVVHFRMHRLIGLPVAMTKRIDERREAKGVLVATTLETRTTWSYRIPASAPTPAHRAERRRPRW